jgi:hypothetical protein
MQVSLDLCAKKTSGKEGTHSVTIKFSNWGHKKPHKKEIKNIY